MRHIQSSGILRYKQIIQSWSADQQPYHIVDFVMPSDHRLKIIESEYVDVARELKKSAERERDGATNCSWGLGMVSKGIEERLDELKIRKRIDSIQAIALSRSARILRRILGT